MEGPCREGDGGEGEEKQEFVRKRWGRTFQAVAQRLREQNSPGSNRTVGVRGLRRRATGNEVWPDHECPCTPL